MSNRRFIDIHVFDAVSQAKIPSGQSFTIQYPKDGQITVPELHSLICEDDQRCMCPLTMVFYVYDGNTGDLLYDVSVHDQSTTKFESNKLCVYVAHEGNLQTIKKGDNQ